MRRGDEGESEERAGRVDAVVTGEARANPSRTSAISRRCAYPEDDQPPTASLSLGHLARRLQRPALLEKLVSAASCPRALPRCFLASN